MARGTGVDHAAQPTVGALAERRRTIQRLVAAVQDHVTAAEVDVCVADLVRAGSGGGVTHMDDALLICDNPSEG